MNNYLDLQEAISVTGLNEKTIQRFIDAGYIQTREENELNLLNIEDLNKIFGLNIQQTSPAKESELKIEVTLAEDNVENIDGIEDREEAIEIKTQTSDTNVSILAKVVALQDRLIEDKDSQINEQIKEIKWLRTRIEKLEEQSEKDKILLLSGNQTINRLIEINGEKKGWFGRTLTWLSNKE